MASLFLVFAYLWAAVLNMLYDTPHQPESRPAYAEVCWSYTSIWIEIAGPDSYVCDGTGTIVVVWD